MSYITVENSLDKEWIDLIFEARNLKIPFEEIRVFIKERTSLYNDNTLDQEWVEMILEARKLGISKDQISSFLNHFSIYY